MATSTTIVTKNTAVASTVPSAGQLVQGELAINVTDKKLYTLDGSGNVILLATGSAYDVPITITVSSASTAVAITQTGNGAGLTVAASGTGDTVRITNTYGSLGNAFVVEDSASTDATPFVIDNNGTTVIGNPIAYATVASATAITPKLQVQGTTLSTASSGQYAWSGTNPYYTFNKSANAAGSYSTALTANTTMGVIQFNGSDSSALTGSATISGQVDVTATSGKVPGRLVFSTAAATSGTITERMRIDSSGSVGIGTSSPTFFVDAVGTARSYGYTSTAISTPATPTAVSASGGSLSIANWYFKIVAVDALGGVTLPSLESTVAVTSTGFLTMVVSWTATAAAKTYQVWYSNTSGTQANYLTSTTNSLTITSLAGAIAGTLPVQNTTGAVGIGTTTPTNLLEVSRTQSGGTTVLVTNGLTDPYAYSAMTIASDAGAAILNVNSSAASTSPLLGDAGGAGLYTTGGLSAGLSVGTFAGPLRFFAGSSSTERMRVTTTGALAINGSTNYGTSGQVLTSNGNAAPTWSSQVLSITFIIDGGGAVISTGIKGDLTIPFACTITEWTLLADQSGSVVVDIWKDTYANYPPTVADTITASAKPTITTAVKGQSSTLTGWTTAIAAGNTLRFNVDSCTSITRVTLSLKVSKP